MKVIDGKPEYRGALVSLSVLVKGKGNGKIEIKILECASVESIKIKHSLRLR